VVWTFLFFVATADSAYVLFTTDGTLIETLRKSQRPWVVAESIERLPSGFHPEILCHIGHHLTIRNTGNSIATGLISDSRAVQIGSGFEWLKGRVDKFAEDTIKQRIRLSCGPQNAQKGFLSASPLLQIKPFRQHDAPGFRMGPTRANNK
jgi:hypothetical protein